MQKAVTICLNHDGSRQSRRGFIEEHLEEYPAQGWRVTLPFGLGGGDDLYVHGWLAAVLEK